MDANRRAAPGCLICGSGDVTLFAELPEMPAYCNVLWPTRDVARRAPTGEIRLGVCGSCGYVANLAFDPARLQYGEGYETSLHFSPEFQRYASQLADELVARYDLRGKAIVEIGCGNGDFLALLCERGGNRGVGFDPVWASAGPRESAGARPVTFVGEVYSERHAGYPADLVCFRHVLEHVRDPVRFLAMLRRTIGGRSGTIAFCEVPDARLTLRGDAIWDIIYEHCSYFTPATLARAFAESGFRVLGVATRFGDQFLTLEAAPADAPSPAAPQTVRDPDRVAQDASGFAARYRAKLETWRETFGRLRGEGRRAVVWGAGSKGVTFLNALGIHQEIEYVVDVNPRKQGKYLPLTAQRVVPPEFLSRYRPDVAIVMNPIYRDEIGNTLARLGVRADLVTA